MPINTNQLKGWSETNGAGRLFSMPRVAAKCFRLVDEPIALHHTLIPATNKPALEMVISESFRTIQGMNKFYRADRNLRDWDISQISTACCRMWFEMPDKRILPAVMRWEELGKVARSLGREVAEVTREIATAADNKLILTGRMKDEGDLPNAAIRQLISDYLAGQTRKKPPVLYADVMLDYLDRPFIRLGKDREGNQLILPIRHLRSMLSFSFIAISFTSRTEIELEYFIREVNALRHQHRYEQELDFSWPQPKLEERTASPPAKNIYLTDLKSQVVSKKVESWLLDFKVDSPLVLERTLGRNGEIILCSVGGIPYYLTGLNIFTNQMKKVMILLQKEKIEGEEMKTASIFPTGIDPLNNRDQVLAVYKLPLDDRNRGVQIFKKLI